MSYWTVEKGGEKDLRSKIMYKVKKKNKANKYKNFKNINKAKISFDARTKIKVKALLINNRNKNQ